jgi:hypothetical protein
MYVEILRMAWVNLHLPIASVEIPTHVFSFLPLLKINQAAISAAPREHYYCFDELYPP